MSNAGDLRILGARDGYVSALIWVRSQIYAIDGRYAPGIHPRHKRKRSARDAVLRPLKELEARLNEAQQDAIAAYEKSRS
jgi:hypothetical protein